MEWLICKIADKAVPYLILALVAGLVYSYVFEYASTRYVLIAYGPGGGVSAPARLSEYGSRSACESAAGALRPNAWGCIPSR